MTRIESLAREALELSEKATANPSIRNGAAFDVHARTSLPALARVALAAVEWREAQQNFIDALATGVGRPEALAERDAARDRFDAAVRDAEEQR